jgi:glycosyl transferase family 4
MKSAQSSAVSPRSPAPSPHFLIFSLIFALLILVTTLAVFRTPTRFHAYVVIEAPENLSITVLFKGHERTEDCEATIASMASVMRVGCPSCPIKQAECLLKLNSTQQKLLSSEPLDTPSTRVPGGVVTYSAPNMATALATCQASQRFAAKSVAPITCFPVNTASLVTEPAKIAKTAQVFWNTLALIAAGLAAWFTCWLIIHYERLYGRLGDSPVDSSVQNFHSVPTPRIGSLALFAGLLVGGGVLLPFQARFDTTQFGYLLLAGTPAFLGGIVEDVTKKVAVRKRLLLTMLAGSVGALLLGAILNRVDIPGVDTALQWLPFAVAFTVFAVGGIANAMNIVDGYNGLAGGFALIVLVGIAWVAAQVGDAFILTTVKRIAVFSHCLNRAGSFLKAMQPGEIGSGCRPEMQRGGGRRRPGSCIPSKSDPAYWLLIRRQVRSFMACWCDFRTHGVMTRGEETVPICSVQ